MDSKLQIISGEFRGRKLKLSGDARPTQNLARGAIFNSLAGILLEPFTKINAWDAFAGSGALGLEVLSRYHDSNVIFTDTSPESVHAITENTRDIDWARYKIEKADAASRIWKYAPRVNLVFVDPPYSNPELGMDFVDKLADAGFHGIVVQEIESNVNYAPDTTKWEILRDKKYGRARFLILRKI
ncbi:MAG: RsmD family RNA methyltransferase [Alphaproteobacteria bacterium]|nr:RsmD family RNA methyltransferase [Alphaproteobacteria bacterium]